MIVTPTAVSPLVTSSATTAWRTNSQPVPVDTAATATPAVSVILGQSAMPADARTYAISGRTAAAPTWERQPDDAISSLMAGNLVHGPSGTRFNGLGAAMLKRFGADADDFSQSVTLAAQGTSASALHTDADNQIKLSIRTASGATVELGLGSQDDGMAVQIKVSGGELTEAERKALVQLSDAFQEAIDGLSAFPPRMALGGLMKFDPAVLSSIDFKAGIKADDKGAINTLEFHADAKSRSVNASGPSGAVKVDVDLSNPAILGNATQQAQAMARYLQQVDAAGSRGRGDKALVSMFKDAFSQMNSDYGVTAPVAGREAPGVIALNAGDHSLLSGLADFNASMVQPPVSSNPMRPEEVDTFSYKLSQSTSVTGKDPRNRNIHQDQQAQLSASFRRPLTPEVSLVLTAAKESQFYEYVRIDDQARESADITYEDGQRIGATVEQSASESIRVQRYLMGKLASDTTTPLERKRVSDVRLLLSSVEKAERSHEPEDARRRDQALAVAASLAVLPDRPGALPRGDGETVYRPQPAA
ncbi:hypothetical protein A3K87_24320 [Variovorax paradoxus]|uniref:Lactate dehydrogenase n=1 Tax=Variovorax paradoxus TaxID=34073 RepID=A0AA91I977_VARPD|nr:hypothetical protein [Variovorax paradoxus]OAK60240.1 hypothetical protein A3K87_24320 [Variovorax paradoxus]